MLAIGLAKPERAACAMADAKSVDTGLPLGKRLLPYGMVRLVAPIARWRQGQGTPRVGHIARRWGCGYQVCSVGEAETPSKDDPPIVEGVLSAVELPCGVTLLFLAHNSGRILVYDYQRIFMDILAGR